MENKIVLTNKLSHILNTGGGDVILNKKSYSQVMGKIINGYSYYLGNKFECKYQLVDNSELELGIGDLVYIDRISFKATKDNPNKSDIVGFSIIYKPIGYVSYVLVAGLTKVLPLMNGSLGGDVFVVEEGISSEVSDLQILGAKFVREDIINIENY